MTRPAGDSELVQIVDAALADAARRSGDWLVCRPGCTPCCHGTFAINALDAARLRDGLHHLTATDPARAARLQARIAERIARLPPETRTGTVDGPDDEPCPILCPTTGTCDLYGWRPMTCRVFGPPVHSEDGLGHCELCFVGAAEEQIISAEMHLTFHDLEARLNADAGQASGLDPEWTGTCVTMWT